MAGFSDMTIDPATGLAKPKTAATTLPYIDPANPNALLPTAQASTTSSPTTAGATPAAPATDASLAQGNNDVEAAAQKSALNPSNNGIASNTDAMVQKMQADPSFGYNGQQVKANSLSNYDYNQAKAVDTFKQQNGDLGGNGQINANLFNTILKGNTDRSNLENTLDTQNVDRAQKDWAAAIGAGNTQTTQDAALNAGNIKNLLDVRAGYEGERAQVTGFQENTALTQQGFDIATQEAAQKQGYDLQTLAATYGLQATQAAVNHGYDLDTMSKQFGNTMTQLMATQDFAGAQSELSREATAAIDSNDTASVTANLQRQLDYNTWAQQNGQQFTAQQNAINNALQVSLKTLDLQGQKDLATLNGQIQTGQMLTANDFKASEDALDRSAATDLQQGNIQGQKDILTQKAALDAQAQAAQNDFVATQTKATQAWQTGERLSQDDVTKQAQYYDWAQKNNAQQADFAQQTAVQLQGQTFDEQMKNLDAQIADAKATNDETRAEQLTGYKANLDELAASNASVRTMDQMTLQGTINQSLQDNQSAANKVLEGMKEDNALAMQTQDMDQQTKMAYLNDQLLTAQKDGDVGRQKTIIGFQTTQTLETMTKQGKIQAGLDEIQGDIQSALSSQNYVQADSLQISAQVFKAQEDDKTNALTATSLALQKAGFDYKAIQEAVSNGQITPDAAAKFLNDAATDLGIKVTTADPNAAAAKVLQAQSTQMLQYATTNPKNVNTAYLTNGALDITKLPKNADGTYDTSKLLTDAGNADYYDAVNKTIFGTSSTTTGTNAENATAYDPTQTTGGTNKSFANAPPAAGSTFKYGSDTYTRAAGDVGKHSGDQSFSAVDNTTGETVEIVAGKGVIHPGMNIYDNGTLTYAQIKAASPILSTVNAGATALTLTQTAALKAAGLPSTAKDYSFVKGS